MTYPLLLPPPSKHVISPSFLDGFPPSRVHLERAFGPLTAYCIRLTQFFHLHHRCPPPSSYPTTMKISPSILDGFSPSRVHLEPISSCLPAYCVRFPLFLRRCQRYHLPSSYPATMKMQYLRQFSMVSHRPGLFSNAFYNILNAMSSVFASAFALVVAFVVATNTPSFIIFVISQAFPCRSTSLWGHLKRVFRHLSICDNHFERNFIFDIVIIPLPFTAAFSIVIISLVSVIITISPSLHYTSVSLIGKSGGWFAVSVYGWPSI